MTWQEASHWKTYQPSPATQWIWTDVEVSPAAYALVVKDDSLEPKFEVVANGGCDLYAVFRRWAA